VRARFSIPAEAGPGAHPVSYTMDIEFLSRGYGRAVALTTHPYLAPRLKRLPLCAFMADYRGELQLFYVIELKNVESRKRTAGWWQPGKGVGGGRTWCLFWMRCR
jgi:hypothetical protein